MQASVMIFAIGIAYLLGSIPFGLLLTRFFGAGDIRQIGSGNIGATNVMRTGRKGLAVATLLLDLAKGSLAVILAKLMGAGELLTLSAGLAAILGHIFPVWLRFKGGKGVATALGVVLAAHAPLALMICLVWVLIFAVTRFSSLAAIMGFCASPIIAFIISDAYIAAMCLLVAVIIIYTHRQNISRILSGTEHSFSKIKK